MAFKKKIKKSEARILIFIINVPRTNRSMAYISKKLQIDLAYLSKLLTVMEEKHWIKRIQSPARHQKFIEPAYSCPTMEKLIEAKND